jgi:hypothetical protein
VKVATRYLLKTLREAEDEWDRIMAASNHYATERVLMVALEDLSPQVRAAAAMHSNATTRVQLLAAHDPDPSVRLALAKTLYRRVGVNEKVSLRVLKELQLDTDPRVREVANQARDWVRYLMGIARVNRRS